MTANIDHDHSLRKNSTPSSNLSSSPKFYEEKQIFSSDSQIMDYIKSKGIQTRIGVAEEDFGIFILKELIDNAVDFIEEHVSSFLEKNEKPIIKVIIEQTNSTTKIRVINSNAEIDVFSEDLLRRIFTFNKFYSSKRNRYQISRGTLGDALKEVLCVPYAIADKKEIEDWKHGLEITTGNKQIDIKIDIDKIRQNIKSKINKKNEINNDYQKFTEISIIIPTELNYFLVWHFLFKYSILNPHIEFYFQLPKLTDINHNNKIIKKETHLKSVQQLKKYSNRQSIYYYSLTEFKNLIFSIEDDNLPIYYLVKDFRETTNIKKEQLMIPMGYLKHHDAEIANLYKQFRKTLRPKNKLELPYELSKTSRQEAFRRRLEQHGFEIDKISYQLIDGYNELDDKNIEYPFYIEVMLAHVVNLPKNIDLIQGLNSSIHRYSPFYGNRNDTFQWIGWNKKIHNAYSVSEIFEKHGYSIDNTKHKKPKTIAIINLISPRIEYKNYGKSQIDLKPFADSIATNISKVCKNGNKKYFEKPTAKILLVRLLQDRLVDINKNSELKYIDRWTQSTVFYRLRPILIANGIEVSRRYITSSIKSICEELGKSREELGIFAADRAQLYFDHISHDVGLDELSSLMKMGTDLIIIEKEGAVEVLAPFADKYGIALLNSRGFLTEYANRLSSLSKNYGSNVVILTDFDVSGLLLATKIQDNNICRIGIDLKTIHYFGLDIKSVQERYSPDNSHLQPLQKMANNNPVLQSKVNYLRHHRIEIDSVLAKVGSERFWNFILEELSKLFVIRNYNRAIDIPEYIFPKEIESFVDRLKVKISKSIMDEREKIKKDLEFTEGFIDDIEEKKKSIEERLLTIISNDKDIEDLVSNINKINI